MTDALSPSVGHVYACQPAMEVTASSLDRALTLLLGEEPSEGSGERKRLVKPLSQHEEELRDSALITADQIGVSFDDVQLDETVRTHRHTAAERSSSWTGELSESFFTRKPQVTDPVLPAHYCLCSGKGAPTGADRAAATQATPVQARQPYQPHTRRAPVRPPRHRQDLAR